MKLSNTKSKMQFNFLKYIIIVCFLFLSGCATSYNPATGRRHVSFFSTEREVNIGKSVSKTIEKHFGLVYDLEKQNRIENIGKKLADSRLRHQITYYFNILDEEEANALALPGGYIYITKGLYEKLETDDQIAAVLAHEMAHIEARHSIHRLQEAIGYTALQVLASHTASAQEQQRTTRAISELFLSYSREDEFEADRLALGYMKKSGYDPFAMLEVLDKLQEISRQEPIQVLRPQTHPYINDRIREIKIVLSGNIDIRDYMNKTFESR